MKDLDIFIPGELVNLCIPTAEFARESKWYSWFNNSTVTKFLEQGGFPNTPDDQVDFFLSQKTSGRLMLIISNKKEYMGIISLSKINLIKKSCDVAIVVDSSLDKRMGPFISLEAMSRMTEHAFNSIGVNRIEAGQHVKLNGWQQRMELLGYKLEGMHSKKFVKGQETSNSVSIACIYDDYKRIIAQRGCLWDSVGNMKLRLKQLPQKSFFDIMSKFFDNERHAYYERVSLL